MKTNNYLISIAVVVLVFVAGYFVGRLTRPEFELIKYDGGTAIFNKTTGEVNFYDRDEAKFIYIDIINGVHKKEYKSKK